MSSPRLGQVGTWEGHTPRDTLHDYSIKKKEKEKRIQLFCNNFTTKPIRQIVNNK